MVQHVFDGIHCFVSVLLIMKDQVTCRIIIKNFFLTANQYSKNNTFHAALKIPVPAPWLFNAVSHLILPNPKMYKYP